MSTDLSGRTIVITGASAGIGAAAARELASRGARVVPVGRSPEKTAAVAREIGAEASFTADFARLADVRRLADDLLGHCEQIDVLANNAGGSFPQRVITEDGFELTAQVDHLATFLLTVLLRERLEATPGARVITTSSVANRMGHIDAERFEQPSRPYLGTTRTYGTAKLLNIVFTRELSRRLAGTGATASCFHPGPVATEFGRDSRLLGLIYRTPIAKVALITAAQGAAPLVSLAGHPDPAENDGIYFDRFKARGGTSRQAGDDALARRVWERSEELVGARW